MTKRKTLRNGKGSRKPIDMEKVYKALDSGRSVQSVAKEWNVSPSTLYRRHHEYQTELEHREQTFLEDLPPLPADMEDTFKGKL